MSDETEGAGSAPEPASVAVVLADVQGPVHLVVGDEVVRIDRIGGAYRVPAALLDAFRTLFGVPADA